MSPTLPCTGRDFATDALKAAAIFGVVFIHAPGQTLGLDPALRFCVPVFVALWAFNYERGLATRGRQEQLLYALWRLERLAVPYIIWTTVYLAINHPSRNDWSVTPTSTIVNGWFGGYGWAGQYFFVILFQWTALMPVVRNLCTPTSSGVLIALSAIWFFVAEWFLWQYHIVHGLSDRPFVYQIAYVAAGICAARFPCHLVPLWLLLLSAGAMAVATVAESHFITNMQPRPSPYVSPFVLALSLSLFAASQVAAPRRIDLVGRIVSYVGRNTFPVYILNPLIIHLLPSKLTDSWRGVTGEVLHLVLSAAIVAVCLAISELLVVCRLGFAVGLARR